MNKNQAIKGISQQCNKAYFFISSNFRTFKHSLTTSLTHIMRNQMYHLDNWLVFMVLAKHQLGRRSGTPC